MAVNPREKGKRGERAAVNRLRELGFDDAQRNPQSRGDRQQEVECPKSLPNIHFEVKYNVTEFKLGTKLWVSAMGQAIHDAEERGRVPVLLWTAKGCNQWYATYHDVGLGVFATVPEEDLVIVLKHLNDNMVARYCRNCGVTCMPADVIGDVCTNCAEDV